MYLSTNHDIIMSAWSMYQCCSQLALQSREPDFVLLPHFQLHASLWTAPPSRHLHTANSTGTLLENSRSWKKRKPRVGFLCHATTHPDRARCARAQARAPCRQMGAQGIMLSVPKETHSPCRSPPFCHQTTASSGWKENGCRRAGAHKPLEAQNKLFTAASLRHFPHDSHASCAWTCCCCLAWLPILMARLPRSIAALSTTTCSQPSLSHVPADPSAVPEPTASSGAYLRRGDMRHISPFAGSLALGI